MNFPLITRMPPKTHATIIGASGSGKSVLFKQLIVPFIQSRLAGVTMIDPHGSLVDGLVEHCANPKNHLLDRDILYFNPTGDASFALNPLEIDGDITDEAAADRADLLVSVIEAKFDAKPEETPRLSRLAYVLAFAVARRGGTLLDILRLTTLRGAEFRNVLLNNTTNAIVRDELFDFDAVARTHPARFIELVESLHNRFVRWLADPRLARLLGQKRGFKPRIAMERRQTVLVKLGGFTYEKASFVGCLLNSMYFADAMRRPPDVSPPHILAVDEAESIMTIVTARAADITRKYGLVGYFSIQRFEQILRNPELADSLLSNSGVWFIFRLQNPEYSELFAKMIALGPHLDLAEWKPRSERPVAVGQRKVITKSHAEGLSRGESQSQGTAHSMGVARGRTYVRGIAESFMASQGKSTATSLSHTDSVGSSRGNTSGESTGTTYSKGHGESHGVTHGSALSSSTSQSAGTSSADTNSDSASLSLSPPSVDLLGFGAPSLASPDLRDWYPSSPDINSMSISVGHASMTGSSLSQGSGLTSTTSSNESASHSTNESSAKSRSRSSTRSEATSESSAATRGTSEGSSIGTAYGRARSEAEGWSESVSEGLTNSLTHATNRTNSQTEGTSEAFVTEYVWLPSQTYTLQEQIARTQGTLMSLRRQDVMVHVAGETPRKLRTPDFAPSFASDRYRDLMVPRFLARCASKNPWLISTAAADAAIAENHQSNVATPKGDPAQPETFDVIDDPAAFSKRFWEQREKQKPRKRKPTLHVVKPTGDNSDDAAG